VTPLRLSPMDFSGPPNTFLLLGCNGAGMTPLALYLRQLGHTVIGWDDQPASLPEATLSAAGVDLPLHPPLELEGVDAVIYSNALSPAHPLVSNWRNRSLPVWRRGEFLPLLAEGRELIVVVGSHGKSTTTALLIHELKACGESFDYIPGAFFQDDTPPVQAGAGNRLLLEVDESDGTIEGFSPAATLFVSWDWDHVDVYRDRESLRQTFARLFARTTGPVFLHPADAAVFEDLAPEVKNRFILTKNPEPDASFNDRNRSLVQAALTHWAVVGSGDALLKPFPGVKRRQELILETSARRVFLDYAHHPTEIRALLESRTKVSVQSPLAVVFQSHRFSRTRMFAEEFATALAGVDHLYLLPTYGAGEKEAEPEADRLLVRACEKAGRGVTVLSLDAVGVQNLIATLPAEGDLIFIGAGDLDRLARAVAARLKHPEEVDAAWLSFMEAEVSAEGTVARNEPLAPKTTLKVGGTARCYSEPATVADLALTLEGVKFFGLRPYFLGRGSNLIIPDEGVDGCVIRLQHPNWREIKALSGNRLWVGGGVRLKELCGASARLGLSGFEGFEGIPGSVGGSLRMNAGAMGSWMFDVVESVLFMTPSGRLQFAGKEAFTVNYRECRELVDAIALGAVFRSTATLAEASIREQMQIFATHRKASQPRGSSAGCIFKNPPGTAAGKLIDEHGLKGSRVGQAVVSTLHGNFILNEGGATAADVLALIRYLQHEVESRAGVVLEREVQIFGQGQEKEVCHV
jgi:UDP-N-acetylmuramate--alanine ligase